MGSEESLKIEAITDDEYETLQAGALAWARANTTRRRGADFLGTVGFAWGG